MIGVGVGVAIEVEVEVEIEVEVGVEVVVGEVFTIATLDGDEVVVAATASGLASAVVVVSTIGKGT